MYNDQELKKASDAAYEEFVSLGRPPIKDKATEFRFKAGFNKGAQFVEDKLIKVMDEVHRLRSLEDSYDTEDAVLGELLHGLNKLCNGVDL